MDLILKRSTPPDSCSRLLQRGVVAKGYTLWTLDRDIGETMMAFIRYCLMCSTLSLSQPFEQKLLEHIMDKLLIGHICLLPPGADHHEWIYGDLLSEYIMTGKYPTHYTGIGTADVVELFTYLFEDDSACGDTFTDEEIYQHMVDEKDSKHTDRRYAIMMEYFTGPAASEIGYIYILDGVISMLELLSEILQATPRINYEVVVVEDDAIYRMTYWRRLCSELDRYLHEFFFDLLSAMTEDMDSVIQEDVDEDMVDKVYDILFARECAIRTRRVGEWDDDTDWRHVLLWRSWSLCFLQKYIDTVEYGSAGTTSSCLLERVDTATEWWQTRQCNIVLDGLCEDTSHGGRWGTCCRICRGGYYPEIQFRKHR